MNNILQTSFEVKHYAKENEWLAYILQRVSKHRNVSILDGLFMIIRTLITQNITVKQVIMILGMLQSEDEHFKSYYWNHIFQLIQAVWHSRKGIPDNYFDFSDRDPGIILPSFKIPSGGYSFFCWIQIEDRQVVEKKFCLYSFVLEDHTDMTVMFNGFTLSIKHSNKKSKNELKAFNYKFQPGTWYFIALTHVSHRIKQDEFSLYVNGKLEQSVRLSYPKSDRMVKEYRIGKPCFTSEAANTLQGQISGLCLMEEALSSDGIQSLYARGTNLFSSKKNVDQVLLNQKSVLFLKKPSILFLYSPLAIFNDMCIELSSGLPDRRGIKLSGVKEFNSVGIQEALFTLGGIQLLLPLFSNKLRPENCNTADVNNKVISLITELIRGNDYYMNQMLRTNFFDIMGLLLSSNAEQRSPGDSPTIMWSDASIPVIQELLNVVSAYTPEPLEQNQLFSQLLVNVLLNIKIWVNAQPEVQKKIISLIQKYEDSLPKVLYETLPVPHLLSILSEFYSYKDDGTGGYRWTVDDHKTLMEIRAMILRMVLMRLNKDPSHQNLSTLIGYIHDSMKSKQAITIDVLQMLLQTICSLSKDRHFIEFLHLYHDIRVFIPLLKYVNEKHRAWTLKIIGTVMLMEPFLKKLYDNAVVVVNTLKNYTLSTYEYMCLLEISFGSIDPNFINHLKKEQRTIVFPKMISQLFELVKARKDPTISLQFLRDIIKLCRDSEETKLAILSHVSMWQHSLLSILCDNPKSLSSTLLRGLASEKNPQTSNNICELCCEAFALILSGCIPKRGGHVEMQITFASLDAFPFPDTFTRETIMDTIVIKFLRYIFSQKYITTFMQRPTTYNNVMSIASLIEYCLFDVLSDFKSVEFGMMAPRQKISIGEQKNLLTFLVTQLASIYLESMFEMIPTLKITETFTIEMRSSMEWMLRSLSMRIIILNILECCYLKDDERKIIERDTCEALQKVVVPFTNSDRIMGSIQVYISRKSKNRDLESIDFDVILDNNLKELVKVITSAPSMFIRIYVFFSMKIILRTVISKLSIPLSSLTNPQNGVVEKLMIFWKKLIRVMKQTLQNDGSYQKVLTQMNACTDEEIIFSSDRFKVEEILRTLYHARELIANQENQTVLRWRTMLIDRKQDLSILCDKLENEHKNILRHFTKPKVFRKNFLRTKREYRMRIQQHHASVASEWKNTIRLLSESRGPWSNFQDQTFYWKLDRSETDNRRRLRLKRLCGDVSYILNASKINDTLNGVQEEDQLTSSTSSYDKTALIKIVQGSGQKSSVTNDNLELEVVLDSMAVHDMKTLSKSNEEKTFLTENCDYIKGIVWYPGEFEITNLNIHYSSTDEKILKTIPLAVIQRIYPRRYNLNNTAIEIFANDKTYFFNFKLNVKAVISTLVAMKPDLKAYVSPNYLQKRLQNATERWRRRLMCTFDYLMELNTLSGRTFSDVSQYPVFPWVISDYTSSYLDLNNPKSYRDLSKPIGSLNPERLKKYWERWHQLSGTETPNFLYGSHYSSTAIVLYYMLRIEPFTSYSLKLQGGRFDYPVRMFWSIEGTWNNCLENPNDVKELIPEFYYLPDLFRNPNNLNFGRLKDGVSINDVVLPPWAESPEAFVQLNRMALESEYVSANIHHWIDLIFGYKQRGEEAVKANNVFYYLTYENSVQWDDVDPAFHGALRSQIREFGQTPSQIFHSPHPQRLPLDTAIDGSEATSLLSTRLKEVDNYHFTQFRSHSENDCSLVFIGHDAKNERIVLAFKDNVVIPVSVKASKGQNFPLSFTSLVSEDEMFGQRKKEFTLDHLFSSSLSEYDVTSCFALSQDGKYLFHGGNWDRTLSASTVQGCNLHQTIREHKDIVTSLSLSQDGETLVTASLDCSILIWDAELILNPKKREKFSIKPRKTLIGNGDKVNSLIVDSTLDLLVTASDDSTCSLYSLKRGEFIRTIQMDAPVQKICLTCNGEIISYCSEGETLCIHSINGVLLKKITNVGKVTCFKTSIGGDLLVMGGHNFIMIRSLVRYSLNILYQRKRCPPIETIETLQDDNYLLYGLADGTLLSSIFNVNNMYSNLARYE